MESSKYRLTYWVGLIIFIGVILRVALGLTNPPSNAFDDYLEPIAYYINEGGIPHPANCWECYQPPLYFYVASGIFNVAHWFSQDIYFSWNCVQFLSVMCSIVTLFVVLKILTLVFGKSNWAVLVGLSLASIFPRDIYTAAMISNDAMLIMFVSLAVLFYINYFDNPNKVDLLGLSLSVMAAAWTKQHGLIVCILPASIIVRELYHVMMCRNKLNISSLIVTSAAVAICLVPELKSYLTTGFFAVSNQEYFPYAVSQPPGRVELINFMNIQFMDLFRRPHLGPNTWSSFWTVVFAGTWFDYEPRFTSVNGLGVKLMAQIFYTLGIVTTLVLFNGTRVLLSRFHIRTMKKILLGLVALGYILIPLAQTIRYPYFSSMKSLFIMPAVSILMIVFVSGINQIMTSKKPWPYQLLIVFLLLVGVFHIVIVINQLPNALQNLSGPLWLYPKIN